MQFEPDPRHERPARRRPSARVRRQRLAAATLAVALIAAAAAGIATASRSPRAAHRAGVSPAREALASPQRPARAQEPRPRAQRRESAVRTPPVVAQRLHNDCEAAALESLLAALGVHVSQLTLQREMPRSGPLDPVGSGPDRVWGDPSLGFVGRPDGGGAAGGFGVYEGPVRRVAARYGRHLADLTGAPAATLFAHLRAGRPVLAWIALSNGPYDTWVTPRGRRIHVNYGEHAIVVYRLAADDGVRVMNPLHGRRETWTRAAFVRAWHALGSRALGA